MVLILWDVELGAPTFISLKLKKIYALIKNGNNTQWLH
jgi:hypothetical protein